jgi:Uma2 family endonuclease
MSTKTRLMIADEFFEWPDEPGLRHELIRGEVVTMSLAGGQRGEVSLEIGRLIANHVKAHRLGKTYAAETGFIIERDPDTVRGADVAFLRAERVALITNPKKQIPFAPDLVVEVRSPNDRDDDVEDKVQMWLKAGVLLVWSVDPESQTVVVYRPGTEPVTLQANETIDAGDVVPGFRCLVAEFFA